MTERAIFRLWFGCMAIITLVVLALILDTERHRIMPSETVVVELVVEPTTTTSTTTTTVPVPTTVATTLPPTLEQFFSCVRWRESRGDYTVVDSTGVFMGAYQFYQGGWDSIASKIGRNDLVGVKPNHAIPADQDAIAYAAYKMLGSAPWGGACE